MKEGFIKAKYRKLIPCYYNLDTQEIIPKYILLGFALDFLIWYDYEFNDAFYIWLES